MHRCNLREKIVPDTAKEFTATTPECFQLDQRENQEDGMQMQVGERRQMEARSLSWIWRCGNSERYLNAPLIVQLRYIPSLFLHLTETVQEQRMGQCPPVNMILTRHSGEQLRMIPYHISIQYLSFTFQKNLLPCCFDNYCAFAPFACTR